MSLKIRSTRAEEVFLSSSSELQLMRVPFTPPPSQVKASITLCFQTGRINATSTLDHSSVSSRSRVFILSPPPVALLPLLSFSLFIRNADELKPHSVSWVSFLHLFNTLISQFCLHPTTCSLISCSDGEESSAVLIGSFSLRVHLAQFSRPSRCASTLP